LDWYGTGETERLVTSPGFLCMSEMATVGNDGLFGGVTSVQGVEVVSGVEALCEDRLVFHWTVDIALQ